MWNGTFNNAHGRNALVANNGSENNAFGDLALENNTSGSSNTAIGDDALRNSTWTVVVTSLSVTRPAPVWAQASVTASRSAHLVQVLLLPLITPASSAASTVRRLATPGPKYQYMSINLTTLASSTRRPGGSNTTFNRWTRPAKRCTRLKPVTFKFNSDWKGTTAIWFDRRGGRRGGSPARRARQEW